MATTTKTKRTKKKPAHNRPKPKRVAKTARKHKPSEASGKPRHEVDMKLGRGLSKPRLVPPLNEESLEDKPEDDVTLNTSDAMDDGEQIPLFEYEDADAKEIGRMARQYSQSMKARITMLAEEKKFKDALIEKIKGSSAKPTADGKYKVRAGDLEITITPQITSESVRVKFDKDKSKGGQEE